MIYLQAGLTSVYSANNPRVLYDNAMERGTITTDSEQTGFEAVLAASPFEAQGWKPVDTAADYYLQMVLASAEPINAFAITAHTLGTQGATIRFESSANSGGAWTQIGTDITPADDRPIALLTNAITSDYFRLVIELGATAAPFTGVVFMGTALEFPRPLYASEGTPFNLGMNTEYQDNRTVEGKYVGRSIKRMRERAQAPLANIEESWVTANMMEFIEYSRTHPYFLLPRPSSYAEDIGYTWSEEDIRVVRGGGRNLTGFTV